jgi:hypothetical protein
MSGWRVMHLIVLLACAGAWLTLGFLALLVPKDVQCAPCTSVERKREFARSVLTDSSES